MPKLHGIGTNGEPVRISVGKSARRLRIRESVTELDLNPLSRAPFLREFSGPRGKTLQKLDLSPLRNHRNLRSLDLCVREAPDFSPLLSSEALRTVTLRTWDSLPDLNVITRLPALRSLTLTLPKGAETIDLGPMSDIRLRTLSIRGRALAHIDLAPLAQCGLRALRFPRGKLTSLDLAPLAASGLRELKCAKQLLTELDLGPLAGPKLETVEIHDVRPLRRLDVGGFDTCERLRVFWVDGCGLENFDFTPLAALPKLRNVHVEVEDPRLDVEPRHVTSPGVLDSIEP